MLLTLKSIIIVKEISVLVNVLMSLTLILILVKVGLDCVVPTLRAEFSTLLLVHLTINLINSIYF